jgi:hypothetical protein
MIESWREKFNGGSSDTPFIFFQVPSASRTLPTAP